MQTLLTQYPLTGNVVDGYRLRNRLPDYVRHHVCASVLLHRDRRRTYGGEPQTTSTRTPTDYVRDSPHHHHHKGKRPMTLIHLTCKKDVSQTDNVCFFCKCTFIPTDVLTSLSDDTRQQDIPVCPSCCDHLYVGDQEFVHRAIRSHESSITCLKSILDEMKNPDGIQIQTEVTR